MTRRLLVTYLSITALALAVIVVPLGLTFADRERERLLFDIERDAQAVASLVEEALESGTPPAIDDVLRDYGEAGGRIVVVDSVGISVADSDRMDGDPRDFSTRPEIAAALQGERASGSRRSDTLDTRLQYVAVPVVSSGAVRGAVRVTYPTSALDDRVLATWLRLGAVSAVVLALVAAVGVMLAGSVTRPVRHLRLASERLAGGDLGARVEIDGGVPELRDLAATFNATAVRLDHLVESQRRFVADASHQLRTPLTALRLRLETLAPAVPPAARPKLDAALAETARLAGLVQSLLVLARGDGATPACEPVDVAAVVAARAEAWGPVAAEQGVTLAVDGPSPAWAVATPQAVDQILDNLVSNALDVAPAGSAVTIRGDRRDGWVELHVVDEGPGLAAQARAQAFERFWRPPGASSTGFGLGLPIVRQLATTCGGDARLDAGPGDRGVDAVVRLRAAAQDLA